MISRPSHDLSSVLLRPADERDVPVLGALLVEINDLHTDALPQVFDRMTVDDCVEAFVRARLLDAEG